MRIEMTVKVLRTGEEHLEENHIDDSADPEVYAQSLIDGFNRTLRSHESVRELLGVRIIDGSNAHTHDWAKQNLITVINNRGNYDVMKCSRCGITGKRFGIGHGVTVDHAYKTKVYGTCEGALAQREKLRKKKS